MARTPEGVAEVKAKLIEALEDLGSMHKACEMLDVDASQFRAWRRKDEAFKAKVEEARQIGIRHLEEVAFKRAIEGSDTLLMFMLRSLKPEYREQKTIAHTGADGGPVLLKWMTDEPEPPAES